MSKTITDALESLLFSGVPLYNRHLLLITLNDGTQISLTDADVAIKFQPSNYGSPFTYSAFGPALTVGSLRWTIGTQVDLAEMTLRLPRSPAYVVEGRACLQAIGEYAFDGATVQLEEVYLPYAGNRPDWSQLSTLGSMPLMLGSFSDVMELDEMHCKFQAADQRKLFDAPFPAVIFQPGCNNALYGPACGLSKPAFGVNGTIEAGSGPLLMNTTLSSPDGYFSEGTVKFTTGANSGQEYYVRQSLSAGGQILLAVPVPNAPSIGDSFTAYAGCDRTFSTCTLKFSNGGNFRGTDQIPPSETAA